MPTERTIRIPHISDWSGCARQSDAAADNDPVDGSSSTSDGDQHASDRYEPAQDNFLKWRQLDVSRQALTASSSVPTGGCRLAARGK